MQIIRATALGAAVLALASCGSTMEQRALTGAGTGGAIGAVGTAIVGGPVLAGAAVGAAAGAITGAATSQEDLDLRRIFD